MPTRPVPTEGVVVLGRSVRWHLVAGIFLCLIGVGSGLLGLSLAASGAALGGEMSVFAFVVAAAFFLNGVCSIIWRRRLGVLVTERDIVLKSPVWEQHYAFADICDLELDVDSLTLTLRRGVIRIIEIDYYYFRDREEFGFFVRVVVERMRKAAAAIDQQSPGDGNLANRSIFFKLGVYVSRLVRWPGARWGRRR